jgi:hypothetical protein
MTFSAPITITLGPDDPLVFDYTYPGDITSPNMLITAKLIVTDGFAPYTLYYDANTTTNVIAFTRSSIEDNVLITIFQNYVEPIVYGVTDYSNGFDMNLVLPAMRRRLGWRQPTLAGSPVLSADNLNSASQRFFGQSFHAMCTINTLKANQEDNALSDDDFNTFLLNLQDDMIMRGLNEVFRELELIEQVLLYTRFGYNDIPVLNSGFFVGYVINIANDKSISTKINSATLYFTEDVSFNLYLYEDGVKSPILSIPVTASAWERTRVDFDGADTPELVLKFVRGRRYYFGYFQNDLGAAQGIREQIDEWAYTLCFEAYPLSAPATEDGFGFNHNYRQFPFLPGGINLEMISFKDHTEKIIRNANLFDEMQGLQMAAFALELINNSVRTDATQRITEQKSQRTFMELNQAYATKEVPITPGLKSRIDREIKRLRDTFFPKQKMVSYPMGTMGVQDQLDATWYKQNYRQLTNPPAQVIPSGGG